MVLGACSSGSLRYRECVREREKKSRVPPNTLPTAVRVGRNVRAHKACHYAPESALQQYRSGSRSTERERAYRASHRLLLATIGIGHQYRERCRIRSCRFSSSPGRRRPPVAAMRRRRRQPLRRRRVRRRSSSSSNCSISRRIHNSSSSSLLLDLMDRRFVQR